MNFSLFTSDIINYVKKTVKLIVFSSVAQLCHFFANPCTSGFPEVHQASQSITNSQSLLKFTSIELVMPSNHLILCHSLLLLPSIFPSIRVFLMSQLFASDGQSTVASTSASVLPMSIQDWFPLGWTGLISLQSKGLSRIFSNTTVQKHTFFSFFSKKSFFPKKVWFKVFF